MSFVVYLPDVSGGGRGGMTLVYPMLTVCFTVAVCLAESSVYDERIGAKNVLRGFRGRHGPGVHQRRGLMKYARAHSGRFASALESGLRVKSIASFDIVYRPPSARDVGQLLRQRARAFHILCRFLRVGCSFFQKPHGIVEASVSQIMSV